MRWPLLLLLLPLSGCDAIKGPLGMNKDAEAIGFACRVSQKLPEQCIKENPNLSPTAMEGWKKGDEEVRTKQYGVTLNGPAAPPPAPAAEGEAATEEEKPKEEPKP